MAQPRSRLELYEIFRNEVEARAPLLTDWVEGSKNDAIAGGATLAMSELVDLILEQFAKTFFKSANGPEVTGGPDDLETLAVDHFGDAFARPGATKAVGIVTFSRPNTGAGDVLISAGSIVKTTPDANGNAKRYQTLLTITMTGTSINASIEAVDGEEGTRNNAEPNTITVIETTLTDPSIVVTNTLAISGGEPEEDDATYRETIFNLIQTLSGATKAAVEAALATVSGIEKATATEFAQNVIEWDDDLVAPVPGAVSFIIPRVKCFIADANGTANPALIALAQDKILTVRALGVRVDIYGATALSLNWTAALTLNPSGPNYTEFLTDTSKIVQGMTEYLQNLAIGADFVKNLADFALMQEWGPSGTNDLVSFITTIPVADIGTAENQRLIPGTIATD